MFVHPSSRYRGFLQTSVRVKLYVGTSALHTSAPCVAPWSTPWTSPTTKVRWEKTWADPRASVICTTTRSSIVYKYRLICGGSVRDNDSNGGFFNRRIWNFISSQFSRRRDTSSQPGRNELQNHNIEVMQPTQGRWNIVTSSDGMVSWDVRLMPAHVGV